MDISIDDIRREALDSLSQITDSDALSAWRSQYVGRRGKVTALFRNIGKLPKEERADFGRQVNALQTELGEAYDKREALIESQRLATDPGRRRNRHHPARASTTPGGLAPLHAHPPRVPANLGGHGLPGLSQPRGRRRRDQLHLAQPAAASPRARHAGHLLHQRPARPAAHPHLAGSNPRHARPGRQGQQAHPRHPARHVLSHGAGNRPQRNPVHAGGGGWPSGATSA